MFLVRGLMVTKVGFELIDWFPACARSQMKTLGKPCTLYHSLNGYLLLD